MLTKLKKFAAANLILAMAATVAAPGAALADNDRGHKDYDREYNKTGTRMMLKDVDKHWAKKNVWKLNLEGVIKGYNDGSFLPEKNVSTMEAVVMAVRLLGLEAEANGKMNAQLPFKDAGDIPAWAVGYIAVALDKGIIDTGNGYFLPNKAASRMDATTILVRSLGKQVDNQAAGAQLKFTDLKTMNTGARNYIALAVLNKLITGYEDGSFRPASSVTRAELATLFARAQENNRLGINKYKFKGTLTSVSTVESKISVTTGVYDAVYGAVYGTVYGSSEDYKVITGAAIYRNNQAVELAGLKPQDKVELLLNQSGDVVFIDAKEPAQAEEQNLLQGIVTQVVAANKTLKVLLSGVIEVQYAVAGDAVIVRDGKTVALGDIQVHDRVKMVQNTQGLIANINAVPAQVKKPGPVITLAKVIKIEVKGRGAKIELEQKEVNGEFRAGVELKTPGQKLELKGESAQDFIEKIVNNLNLDQADSPAKITDAVNRVFEPILGTGVQKYEIEIQGPGQRIKIDNQIDKEEDEDEDD